jgi:hypothetical protein
VERCGNGDRFPYLRMIPAHLASHDPRTDCGTVIRTRVVVKQSASLGTSSQLMRVRGAFVDQRVAETQRSLVMFSGLFLTTSGEAEGNASLGSGRSQPQEGCIRPPLLLLRTDSDFLQPLPLLR